MDKLFKLLFLGPIFWASIASICWDTMKKLSQCILWQRHKVYRENIALFGLRLLYFMITHTHIYIYIILCVGHKSVAYQTAELYL